MGDTDDEVAEETPDYESAEVGGKDLDKATNYRKPVRKNERPFSTKAFADWSCGQPSEDGANEWDRED